MSAERIGSNLNSVVETFGQIRNERLGVIAVTLPHNEKGNQFAVGIQRNERSNIAISSGPVARAERGSDPRVDGIKMIL